MMRAVINFLGWVGVLAVAAAAVDAQEDLEWSRPMKRGQTLEVRGIYGNIRAVRAKGDEAAVTARKRGSKRDFKHVDIEVVEARGQVVVCVLHEWRGRGDPCDLERDLQQWGAEGGRDIDVSVDFEISLPAGVEFIGSTVRGDVDVRDVDSEVNVTSVNGGVYVSTVARAQP